MKHGFAYDDKTKKQGGNVGQQQADCSTTGPGRGEMRPMWRRHLPTGMADNRYAEIDAIVKAFMTRNWAKIQGMPEEDRKDLEMDCLLNALEAQKTWDQTKSSLRTWINNNLDWHFKDLAKKERKRIQTMAEYRKHVQSLTNY